MANYNQGELNPGYKHGLSKHTLYLMWQRMKNRCYNRKEPRYKDYGGRGISVCDWWKHDVKTFILWALSHGWQQGLYLDRRDNDGNYNPENCRFIDKGLSQRNTRLLHSNNRSGYRGVSFDKKNNKYQSHITINGNNKNLGRFSDPMQAAIAYDSMAVVLNDGRPTNFQWPK